MKHKMLCNVVLVCIATLAVLMAFGCEQTVTPPAVGELTITLRNEQHLYSRNMDPTGNNAAEVAQYTIEGVGPKGQSIAPISGTQPSFTIEDLYFGDWTITATASNADGNIISVGSVNQHITQSNSNVEIVLDTYYGEGSFNLDLSWDSQQSRDDSTLTVTMENASGVPFSLSEDSVQIANGTATYSGNEIPAGFYTLFVELKTGDELISGLVEMVRIVDQTTTSASRTLKIGKVVNEVSLSIIDNTAAPVRGSISVPTSLAVGGEALLEFTLEANQDVSIEDLSMQWYCEGVLIEGANAASYTIESLLGGTYRYDIVVSLPESGSVGSAGVDVQVDVPMEITG